MKHGVKIFSVVLIVLLWIFSGFPVIWQNPRIPPAIQPSHAADTGAKVAGANATVTSSAGDNNGFETIFGTTPFDTTTSNNGGIQSVNSGTNVSSSCALPNTVSDQHDFSSFNFSIPAGSTITGISVSVEGRYDSSTGTNTFCSFLSHNNGTNWTAGKNTPDVNNTDVTHILGSSSDTWGRTWSTTEFSNANFKLRIMPLVANVARDAFLDHVTVTVSYNPPNSPPNAPTQNSPSNGATGVSTSPAFTMTATDANSDKLGYKVTIYSNSGCTTVVQTNDQSLSSTGWSGTNASCTNNPTSCYTSGTQGTFQTQTSLSANTQYWWKASAKDPDGSGSFTDSSTCNSFTTALISVTVSDGVISYGTVALNSNKDTTASGLNDTQVVTNDGNVSESFNIKGQNSANWTLAGSSGANTYVQKFCTTGSGSPDPCDTSPTWTALTTNYQTLASGIAASGTKKTDFQITLPTTTSNYNQQAVDITIQAIAP